MNVFYLLIQIISLKTKEKQNIVAHSYHYHILRQFNSKSIQKQDDENWRPRLKAYLRTGLIGPPPNTTIHHSR